MKVSLPRRQHGAPLGRNFHLLWAASGVSNLSDGLLLIGAPLLAAFLTRSPLLVSLVTAAIWLPWLLVALPAGAIADRIDRRLIMVTASWSRAAVLILVVASTLLWEINLPVLYLTVLLVGIAEVFSDTTAQSMLPTIVDRERLDAANGRLIGTQTVANNFLGGPLAGLLVALGAGLLFGTAALGYAVSGLLLWLIAGRYRPRSAPGRTLRADIAEGLRHLWQHRLLRWLAAAAALINLGSNAYFAVFVLWIVGPESPVGLTATEYGVVAGVVGVGAALGALLVEPLTRAVGRSQLAIVALVLMAALLATPVVFPTAATVFIMAPGVGMCGSMINVIVVTIRQRLVPDALLGRVNASYRLVGMGVVPVGALTGGVVGSIAGLPTVFFTTVTLCVLAVGLLMWHVSPGALVAAEHAAAGAREK